MCIHVGSSLCKESAIDAIKEFSIQEVGPSRELCCNKSVHLLLRALLKLVVELNLLCL